MSGTVPVVCADAYTIRYEFVPHTGFPPPHNEAVFIHCDVHRWNPKALRDLKRDFEAAHALLRRPLLALHRAEDHKHSKFIKLFGFRLEPALVALTPEGEVREVWAKLPTRNNNG